jgi:hypothetical protein
MEWSIFKTLKNHRGFLGLARYYHKFFKNFGQMVASLTSYLKKDAFYWSKEATQAFKKLKKAMCRTLVLAILDFIETFIVECDALGHGTGAVLMQEGRPLALKVAN